MKNFERILYAALMALWIFSILFFFFPQKANAAMVCGRWYDSLPITACNFVYESNCCIVIHEPK